MSCIDVQADDLVPVHHDVVDGDAFEVDDTEQHVLPPFRNAAGFAQQGSELIHAEVVGDGIAVGRLQKRFHQRIAERVDAYHHGVDQPQQRREHVCRRKRDPLRNVGTDRLRRDFADDEGHQGERQRCDGEPLLAEQFEADQRCQGRRDVVDQVVADQYHPEQPVRAAQQFAGFACATMALFDEMTQPVAVQRHHRGLRTGEEGR